MGDLLTPTTAGILMLAGAVPPLVSSYWLRNDREKPAVRWFQRAMICGMAWSLLFGLITLIEIPQLRFVLTNVFIVVVPASTICYFVFCYEFTFKKRPPKAVFLLAVPVGLMFVLAWSNPYNLIYGVENPSLSEGILVTATPGLIRQPITIGMGYLLVSMSAGMVFGELLRTSDQTRKIQALSILFSIGVISVLGLSKVLGLVPAYFDPTPIGWTVSGLVFAFSIRRYQFLQLLPAAREQITDEIRDPVLVLDPDETVVDCNIAAGKQLGVSVGMTKEELQTQQPTVAAACTDPTVSTIEQPSRETPRYFDIESSQLEYGYAASGQIIFFRDVTERTIAERSLESANERYQTILTRSSDWVAIVDQSGTVTDITPGVTPALGYEPPDVIGTDAFGYVHPEDRDETIAAFLTARSGPEESINAEYRIKTADGSYCWVESRGSSHISDPSIGGVLLNMRDISERKEREQQLAQTTDRLHRKNEQLERLAQIISHDLQTPLSTAEKLTQVLRIDLADCEPAVDQSLSDLEVTHQRLREFTENLPRLARESTDVESPTACDLERLVRAAWNVVATESLTLRVETTRTISGDPRRLQQLFENLFQNTVTHAVDPTESFGDSPRQSATTVCVGSFDGGIYIQDDGPGIQPEQRDELFEYGMGTGSGTGFGLAIVRTIVEAHGWDITVADSEDGARFEIAIAT